MRVAVQLAKAAGGITLDRARGVVATGVDFVSVGTLTHSAPVLDIGLDLRTNPTNLGTT